MAHDTNSLIKVLTLEINKGCHDTAVVGGLGSFINNWINTRFPKGVTLPGNVLVELKHLADIYLTLDVASRHKKINRVLCQVSAPVTAPKVRTGKAKPTSCDMNADITAIPGVSTVLAGRLSRLGVKTIYDMLFLFPNRHLDYSHLKTISQLFEGKEETIIANIWEVREFTIKGRRSTEAILGDSTGNIRAVWFNNPYLARQLKANHQVVLSGRVRLFQGSPVFESPDWEYFDQQEELIHTGRLVPVYPLTAGLRQRQLRKLIKYVIDHYADQLCEFLPMTIIKRNGFITFSQAIHQAHFPEDVSSKDKARNRLAFNELFLLQLGVLKKKRAWQANYSTPVTIDQNMLGEFIGSLPFKLTSAQLRVINEILNDLKRSVPMSRLLQGEVGSGKTIVALIGLLMVVSSGMQAALMAPTEILAQQHFNSITNLISKSFSVLDIGDSRVSYTGLLSRPVNLCLLTGDLKKSSKNEINKMISGQQVDIVIGTHAIIQQQVKFKNLGLVIIDEQHRFGVIQRQMLRKKGLNPHTLVMTATPIPRTLALTLYGDLDLSLIDELPPGRQMIKTKWLKPQERYKAYNFIRKQVIEGRQAFIICPLVEESDALQAKAATVEYENLSQEVFPQYKLGLIHGRMKSEQKESIMRQFHAGLINILVSTPVIEVGIDIPNATVILIESANRFGLSQLHQFRGRVGRGDKQSYCMLITENSTETGDERLKAIEEIQDGFKLAEKDLELRGPGEFFGTRQSGIPDLKMARLSDIPLLETARREAETLFENDPDFSMPQHNQLAIELARNWAINNSDQNE